MSRQVFSGVIQAPASVSGHIIIPFVSWGHLIFVVSVENFVVTIFSVVLIETDGVVAVKMSSIVEVVDSDVGNTVDCCGVVLLLVELKYIFF